MKIGIDCGHTKYAGSSDYGAIGVRPESDLTREVGTLVISKLKQLGHTVINCTVDTCSSLGDSLGRRVSIANSNNLDFYVSIHFNCFNTEAYGTEVFTYGAKKYKQASDILNNLVALEFRNRGIKDGSELYVINSTNCESMLVEVCFCDNQSDMKTIVLYFGDMDANEAIYVAQKSQSPMMKKSDFDVSGLKAENVIIIGGRPGTNRHDSLKDAAKLV